MPNPAKDLHDKLVLEKRLLRSIKAYNSRILKEFRRQYAASGNIVNMQQFDDDLEDILKQHYDRVITVFSNRISPNLPLDVAVTEGERDVIEEALMLWMIGQAAQEATFINITNQKEANESVALALDDDLVQDETGVSARLTAAAVAAAILRRKMRGRENTIAISETQIAAETAKATEVEVLSGVPPSVTGGARFEAKIKKEWISVGDSKVRDAHISADGQVQDLNTPFSVGGEELRWPGDRSLGASAGNVINCRCSSVTMESHVAALRRRG